MTKRLTASHIPYTGSGPYCYSNSLAMMFGEASPSASVIEFATASPFGMLLIGGTLPFFDPYGWDPESGFEDALAALGWTSTVNKGGNEKEALTRLSEALEAGPVLVGPVEMGHLGHQPGMKGPIGADHYVVVLGINEERVIMHDPQGYPYASLPLDDFTNAWHGSTLSYGEPFTMRTGFKQIAAVSDLEVIRTSIPAAIRWLSMGIDRSMPQGSLGNGEAAKRLAELVEHGCDKELYGHLIHFAVRVGTRRYLDAATCLSRAGYAEAARIADEQARLIGSTQHMLVVGDNIAAAAAFRALVPTYDKLLAALLRHN